jgi:hypothetical protein
LEVLERERKPGRKAKWLYRKAEKFEERIVMAQSCLREGDLGSLRGPPLFNTKSDRFGVMSTVRPWDYT